MSGHAWHPVWDLVRRIPSGKVMTYGQIADLLERPLSARAVGWALHGCPTDVPWHRVVNAAGKCSTDRFHRGVQRELLEDEGVRFSSEGNLDLARYRWEPI